MHACMHACTHACMDACMQRSFHPFIHPSNYICSQVMVMSTAFAYLFSPWRKGLTSLEQTWALSTFTSCRGLQADSCTLHMGITIYPRCIVTSYLRSSLNKEKMNIKFEFWILNTEGTWKTLWTYWSFQSINQSINQSTNEPGPLAPPFSNDALLQESNWDVWNESF